MIDFKQLCRLEPKSIDLYIQNDINIKDLKYQEIKVELGLKYTKAKQKGGKARHSKTDIIKIDVIKPMFLHIQKASPKYKVNAIAKSIIEELFDLQPQKHKEFIQTYSIKNKERLKHALEYIAKKEDGGQIQEWCYHISQGKI